MITLTSLGTFLPFMISGLAYFRVHSHLSFVMCKVFLGNRRDIPKSVKTTEPEASINIFSGFISCVCFSVLPNGGRRCVTFVAHITGVDIAESLRKTHEIGPEAIDFGWQRELLWPEFVVMSLCFGDSLG